MAGNMVKAEAEGQATKGQGRTASEDEANGRASKSERRPGNMAAVLPPPWLFGQGVDIFSPQSNTVKKYTTSF